MSNISFTHFTDYSSDNKSVILKSKPVLYSEIFDYSKKNEDHTEVIDTISTTLNGVVAKVPSSEFYSFWSQSKPGNYRTIVNSILESQLPICVRYKSENCVVVERPPFKVPVRINYRKSHSRWGKRKKNESSFTEEIWVPWTIVILSFPNGIDYVNPSNSSNSFYVSMYFRSSPLTSFDDSLILPYTPNIFNDGKICLGESYSDFHEQLNNNSINITNISQVYQYIISQYFSGGWNLDLGLAGIDYHVHRDLFDKEFLDYVHEKAKQNNNKYILSVFKQYGKEDLIKHFSEKSRIKFIFSFLSCLDLHETLDFVNKIQDINRSINEKFRDRYHLSLRQILGQKDPSFSFNYDSDIDESNLEDSLSEIESEYSESIARRCISSSNNSLALNSWKIKIVFHLQDFLNYFSDRMLSHYCNNSYRELNREDFYKKNVRTSILNSEYSWFFRKVYLDYIFEINEKCPEFNSCLKEVIISLSDYYHNFSEGSFKHEVILDLSEKNILLDQSLLEKEVATL